MLKILRFMKYRVLRGRRKDEQMDSGGFLIGSFWYPVSLNIAVIYEEIFCICSAELQANALYFLLPFPSLLWSSDALPPKKHFFSKQNALGAPTLENADC
ncbi:jg6292 [Pararge aegeria aegeria]|uniref:Jg6292 protein n=1 Tax=Pararge aegeria aegeria TaxID=348720 RepID=A0A8S4QIG6_9NEOP|nr:jg6292 [Pararge aegeria aegeria]